MRHSLDLGAKRPHNGHCRRRARTYTKRGLEMSLLAFPPNHIIDSRSKQDYSYSRKWLEKLTETAVEKAFKLQLESRRLVDIVDTHSCGDTGGLGCSMSPISSKVSRNLSISSSLASRKWVLPKNSKDRRRIATKIYTLLLQWKSDFSDEWRARVVAAVPVLEEAIYQQAKSKDDYRNVQLLHSNLKTVLCHFEAGNGPFLVQGMTPLYPVKTRYSFPPAASGDEVSSKDDDPMDRDHNSHSDSSDGSEIQDITIDEPFGWERVSVPRAGNDSRSPTIPSQRTQAKPVNRTELARKGTLIHGGYPRRKIVKRLINLLSNKRKEDHMLLRHEFTRANHSAERIAKLLSKAEMKIASRDHGDEGGETSESSQSDNNAAVSWSRPLTRTRSDSRLIGMLGQNPQATRKSESDQRVSATVEGSSGERRQDERCSSESIDVQEERISASCLSRSQSLGPETTNGSKPVEENSSSAQSSRTLSLANGCVEPTQQKNDSGTVRSISMELDVDYSPKSSASPSSVPAERSVRQSMGSMQSADTAAGSLLSASTAPSQLPDSSDPSRLPLVDLESSLPAVTEQMPPVSSELGSTPLQEQQVASDNSNSLQQGQRATAEGRTIKTGKCKAKDEPESSAMVAASTSGGHNAAQPRTGGGVRVPLSTFLAQRDEHSAVTVPNTSYEPGPWDTWEEPTEQLDPLCCVCMVGLKGACFIPCGHTFCRKCSRELWKGRGTCPLCNRYIIELLDIY